MHKYIILFACILIGHATLAQSKKELKAEIEKLKAEIEQLKQPPTIDLEDKQQKLSYSLGVSIGMDMTKRVGEIDSDALKQGVDDVTNDKVKVSPADANVYVMQEIQRIEKEKAEKMRAAGEAFLEKNKQRSEVTTLPSGLQYEVVTEGTGAKPAKSSDVVVHYTGKLVDGTVFDSSVERGQPATLNVSRVIKGWTEALQLMPVGAKWKLYIPQELGYGERGAGQDIPPYATLIFEVELIEIK
ncbi:MAG: FKBP-type peptidyl-prolyl cis-trans isomerase [Thermonemataceae bacterium]